MPSRDDVFEEICKLVQEGAAPTALDAEVRSALHTRYYEWIESIPPRAKELPTGKQRPIEVWDLPAGAQLKDRFRQIGQSAAKQCKTLSKSSVDSTTSASAFRQVEAESDCPFCPPPPKVG